MMKKTTVSSLLMAAVVSSAAAFAGGPTPAHPCYDVADCKTKGSQEEFSACIKANEDAANANPACAAFRADKKAYMQAHGIGGVKDLFE